MNPIIILGFYTLLVFITGMIGGVMLALAIERKY